jgi:hypothetical protein
MPQRTWKPLSNKRLADLIADLDRDNYVGDYCAEEVYRLAREVDHLRKEAKRLQKALDATEKPHA